MHENLYDLIACVYIHRQGLSLTDCEKFKFEGWQPLLKTAVRFQLKLWKTPAPETFPSFMSSCQFFCKATAGNMSERSVPGEERSRASPVAEQRASSSSLIPKLLQDHASNQGDACRLFPRMLRSFCGYSWLFQESHELLRTGPLCFLAF